MAKFRKKPVVIEAVKVTPETLTEVCDFMGGEARRGIFFVINYARSTVSITTLEGTMKASTGDWIIKGVQGEFYPCKPDIFAATYELVEPPVQEPSQVEVRQEKVTDLRQESTVSHD